MYNPIQDGIAKTVTSVQYTEAQPPLALAELVHCFWELKTQCDLHEDFYLHAIPDACINILFNQLNTTIAGVTALRITYTELNLGKRFHYVGIQFLPGAWQGDLQETTNSFVGSAYQGNLPLLATNDALSKVNFSHKQPLLSRLVEQLSAQNLVTFNPITSCILHNIDNIKNVANMASFANISPRQLQRTLKQSTGFSPHDFLKVIRLQQSFKQHYLDAYTDQSHFIHCFRKITGYTPAEYYRKYDV